jgi:hypothetical protein
MFRHRPIHQILARLALASGLSIAVACLVVSSGAEAASCLDQVRELAQRYKVSTEPPSVSPGTSPGATTRQLGESGGVMQPPPVEDRSVIAPPSRSADRMPTMPDLSGAPKDSAQGDAAQRTTLQSLLMAARDQAEHGQESQCLASLEKARQLLQRTQ